MFRQIILILSLISITKTQGFTCPVWCKLGCLKYIQTDKIICSLELCGVDVHNYELFEVIV